YDIDQDAEGNLWFTVYAYGLIKFDGMAFTHYNSSAGLPTKNLNNLVIDDKNRFWISADIGLLFFQPEKQTFRLINEQDGLSNSSVQAIDIDPSKNLWIGTRKGLNLLDPNEQDALAEGITSRKIAFKKYLFDDGMIGIGVSRGAILADSSGKIWTGGNNYLSVHLPEFQRPEKAAAVTITGLDLFNDKITWKEILNTKIDTTFQLSNGIEINDCRFDSVANWSLIPLNPSFKYDNNFLTFNFVGITTYQPEQVQYQYILEGWDDTWSGVTSRTSAPYVNLPPGNYTFKVKAINSSGNWSEPAAYKFEIRSPWFWNIWSKLGYLISIILASIATFRWRTSEFRKRQR
ncbi:MAG: triple tyrosine motif-containing protein, partial [Flavobacteriales bacterium]